jgi:hypothetical protein
MVSCSYLELLDKALDGPLGKVVRLATLAVQQEGLHNAEASVR